MKGRKFIDRVRIDVTAGNGGNGIASFRREKYVPKGGPDGGDGGRGGHVFLRADAQTDSLIHLYYQPVRRAENGGDGRHKGCHGKNGEDLYLKVPLGTEVTDAETEEWVGELLKENEDMMIARGGKGGLGNIHFKTSTHQAPRECTPGEPGDERRYWLELKLISDAGLVGYPNAGKSTLISKISNAHPKVAAYPFTTLNPIIGTVAYENFHSLKVADIPGLIDGAHDGVGLGHDFLRHIERTSFLIYVIDMAGTDGRHPADDYLHLREELRLHRGDLPDRSYLIAANKMDQPEAEELLAEFIKKTGETPLPISAQNEQGLDALKDALYRHFFEV